MSVWISRCLRFCVIVALLAVVVGPAHAGPTIKSISLRGLQAGGTTTLAIDGTELLPDPRLLSTVPIGKQNLKAGGSPQHVEMEVSVDAQASPGIYLLRLATAGGISNAVAVGVDAIAQSPFAAEISALPVTMSGALTGSTVLATSFTGKAGQKIVIDVESRRLGAGLNPVLHLYNSRRVQLTWSQGLPAIGGDARCETVLPADGKYTVELHDALYRGEGEGFFRLKIGDLHFADLVFPLGVSQGAKTPLQFHLTNLPATATQQAPAGGVSPGVRAAPWPAGVPLVTGSRPRLTISDYAEIIEGSRQPGQPQDVAAAPLAINGRIAGPNEVDRYRVPVTAGQRLQFDVLANRAGSPLDGVLSFHDDKGQPLRNEKGDELIVDDRPNTKDPGYDLAVPDGTKNIVVSLRDRRGAGGADYVYRLLVRPVEQPDFSLALVEDRGLAPRGSVGLVRVRAERRNYQGPIKLSFPGMPTHVTVAGDVIPAGASATLVTLTAGDVNPEAGMISVLGESAGLTPPLKRIASVEPNEVSRYQPWLGDELAVGVVSAAPLSIAWEEPSADSKILAGSIFTAAVRVARAAGVEGPVRLSVQSSQPMPKKTMQVANREQLVDAPERLMRIESPPTLPAADSQAKFKVIAPAELADLPYDVAIKAELLSADDKNVLGSAITPARRLIAERPLMLEVAQQRIDAPAGLGTRGKITGKLARKAGFVFPSVVQLVGLPANVASPSIVVPADKNEFELEVAFAFGTAPGDLANVRVGATSQTDPKDAMALVHSNEVPIGLKIVAGTKPKAEKPFRIFEDEPEFLNNLTEGKGTASLLSDEKYSGPVSVKVTPDQRSNPKLPGVSVKIRQHPTAPDEYRYVTFAWKKLLGTTICLQLGHDGVFGPVPGNPAKFRYHAGGASEPFGASVSVNPNIPGTVTLVTRDLFADFGEFTLTGVGLAPMDGDFGLYDHIYLGKTPADFDLVAP